MALVVVELKIFEGMMLGPNFYEFGWLLEYRVEGFSVRWDVLKLLVRV